METAAAKWVAVSHYPKKDDSFCSCVDYWKPNAVAIRDMCPLHRMDKCITRLGEVTVISTLQTSSGCCKIEIDDRDREKTAFTSHHGMHRPSMVPSG